MIAARAMTGFATHIYFRDTGFVTVAGNIEIFLNIIAMTIGTHAVPVLATLRPVHPLTRLRE